jgi:hypothetical protein
MKGKILFVAGGLVGYVLGARAGRKRYEQIRSAASKVWEKPAIQNQVHQAQDYAADKAAEVPDVLIKGATKLVSSIIRRTSSHSSGESGSGTSTSGTGTTGSSGSGRPVTINTTQTRASTTTATTPTPSTPEDDA